VITRQRLAHAAKVVLAYGLYYLGLLQLWQAIVMRRKAVVLMYHRVLTRDERSRSASHPALVVDRDTFAMHMDVLARHFVVLSVEELAERMAKKIAFPDSSCVITFDDGWCDNFTNALPILERFGLPALVFLPVNYIGQRRLFWQEALTHLLHQALSEVRRDPGRRPALSALLEPVGLGAVIDLTDENPRRAILLAIGTQKRHTRATIEQLITALTAELGVPLDELSEMDGFIDWGQVEAMSRRGISFGGHGAEHLLLTHVANDEAEREIRVSKEVLDRRVTPSVPTFSYPNGYFEPGLVALVKAAGYRVAFIARRGLVSCDDDPLTVRRYNIHEDVTRSKPMFLARVVGLL
jgi:peptidoglycan/xylan/chitin deacetylase (PgdA/CDA1 family)